MKKEVLREEKLADGSYEKVTKTTQTPEDGFVRNEEFGFMDPVSDVDDLSSINSKYGWFKGDRTMVSYSTNNSRMIRLAFLAAAILFSIIFLLFIIVVKDIHVKRILCLAWAGSMLFFGYCTVKAGKQDGEEQDEEGQNGEGQDS